MKVRATFSGYVARQFLFWWFSIFLILTTLIALFDTIELQRRTSSLEDVTFVHVISMAAFKLPHMAQKAIPFTVLFGGMMAFWRLNRHRELVVARAAGVSAWEILAPVLIVAVVMGVVKITIYSPFSSAMIFRFEQLEARYIQGKTSLAALDDEGLWLQQNRRMAITSCMRTQSNPTLPGLTGSSYSSSTRTSGSSPASTPDTPFSKQGVATGTRPNVCPRTPVVRSRHAPPEHGPDPRKHSGQLRQT